MMKLITLVTALVMIAGVAVAQTDIDDIQVYTALGDPASPFDGQTVTIRGTVYVPAGVYNNGTHYVQDATGGIAFFNDALGVFPQLGDVVEVTGPVDTHNGEIQIQDPPTVTIIDTAPVPTPLELTPDQVLADYENVGTLVAVTGIVANKTSYQFELETGGAENLIVYIDSTTGIDISGVDNGDEYRVLAPVVVYYGLIEIKPRYQTDLIEDPTLPVISNVACDNYVPMASTPVEVSATITDDVGVASATIYYRDSDGENPHSWQTIAMSNTEGDTYAGTIPAGHSESQIDYYVHTVDTDGQIITLPGNAPDGWSELAVGITTIYEMQWVHPDSMDQDSPYVGKVLNVRGVVTAGTDVAGPGSLFVIQEQEEGPYDGYAWGGVTVFESAATYEYQRGDLVEVGGYGGHYFHMDQIRPHNGDAVNLVAFSADLPPASRVATRVLADDTHEDGNGNLGEAWEAVWVKTRSAMVMDVFDYGFYGEYIVSDTGASGGIGRADSVAVAPEVDLTYEPTIGDVVFIEGYMDYEFYEREISPISDDYVTLTIMVGVDDLPTVENAGGFTAVYPNPFNPATKLEFVVTRGDLTQLNIYNIRGELVSSLVNETLPMGKYQLTWDGRDAEGQSVASGQYFARLRIGKSVMQVRKLSLVK